MGNSAEHRRLQFSIRGVMLAMATIAAVLGLWKWDPELGRYGVFGAFVLAGFLWHRTKGHTGMLGAGLGGGLCAALDTLMGAVSYFIGSPPLAPVPLPGLVAELVPAVLFAFVVGAALGMTLGPFLFGFAELFADPEQRVMWAAETSPASGNDGEEGNRSPWADDRRRPPQPPTYDAPPPLPGNRSA